MNKLFLIIFLFSLIFLIYTFFKKSESRKKKIKYSSIIAIISFILVGMTAPSTPSSAKKQVKTTTKTEYIGKNNYNKDKKYNALLLSKKGSLKKELSSIKTQEDNDKKAQDQAIEKQKADQEKADQEKQAAALAAQKAQEQQNSQQQQQQSQEQVSRPTPNENLVYIAPNHGKKYHRDPNCRGLRNAISVTSMTEAQAQAEGYTLCGWEG
ncbi:hypothetical protein [Companilactobacillus sp. DQM5]|uniref:hypothetical protein n=1 Tax=Companilactobacillus sp. DQM5 TaxID=3463359 RepID=UPI00405898EA